MEFPTYPNEKEQEASDKEDLDLIEAELTEWAAYWGNHSPLTDDAVKALHRIRERMASQKRLADALQQHAS